MRHVHHWTKWRQQRFLWDHGTVVGAHWIHLDGVEKPRNEGWSRVCVFSGCGAEERS